MIRDNARKTKSYEWQRGTIGHISHKLTAGMQLSTRAKRYQASRQAALNHTTDEQTCLLFLTIICSINDTKVVAR